MEGKLTFIIKPTYRDNMTTHMRVPFNYYEKIQTISNKTGLKQVEVIARFLEFGFDHLELVAKEEE